MRRLPAFVLGVLVAGSIFGSLSLVHAQGPAHPVRPAAPAPALPPDPGQFGRFGVAADSQRHVFVIDTQTGEVWSRSTVEGSAWQSMGKPPVNETNAGK